MLEGTPATWLRDISRNIKHKIGEILVVLYSVLVQSQLGTEYTRCTLGTPTLISWRKYRAHYN